MIMGSSGQCNEICGDGLNFGLNECDDGNMVDGDGCSSDCAIERNWDCSGGSPLTKDTCTFYQLDIVGLTVTENNNLIIEFNQAAYILGQLSTPDDFDIRIFRYDGTQVTNFEADFNVVREMPSSLLFVNLKIGDFLQGLDKRSRVEVYYRRSYKVVDAMLRELQPFAYAIGYLNTELPQLPQSDTTVLRAMAIASNFSLVFGFIFTLLLGSRFHTSS
jgi:cysteine-rich repeat protein